MVKNAYVVILVLIFLGCGSIKVIPVKNDFGSSGKVLNEKEAGVRFYRPSLHVWISYETPSDKINFEEQSESADKVTKKKVISTAIKSYKATFVMLPDFAQEYIIKWRPGIFGSVTPKFTLYEGWNLSGFESTINTGMTAAFTASLQEIATAPISGLGFGPIEKEPTFKGAGIYRMEFDKETKNWKLGPLVFKLEEQTK